LKLLHIDIETAPHKVYTWGLWQQNVAINQIVEPGYTLCFAAKWHGERDVTFKSVHESNAKSMLKEAHKLLDEADVVCHYNGAKFDVPTLNWEFFQMGMKPPSPFKQLDLLRETRKNFRSPSNKLDYVVQQLNLGSKTKHMGMEMWRDCMSGCDKAWKTMKRYNIQDVKLLEKYYKEILPWIANHPNWGMYLDANRPTCRNCGSKKMERRGVARTATQTYDRFQCKSCGKWGKGRKSITPPSAGLTT